MAASKLMADFNKKLIDLEAKVIGHGETIEALQYTTKRIKSQREENKNEIKKEQANLSVKVDTLMVMLTYICNTMKITPNQIPQNNEATQHLNSPYSSNLLDSHEKPESPKTCSTPNQENSNTNFENRQLRNPYTNMSFSNQYPFFALSIATYQRRAKLELSKFGGNENFYVAWVNKVEEYFKIYDIDNDDEKIRDASMKMEGETYNWYMWWKKTTRGMR